MATIDSRAQDLVEKFFTQCEPVVAGARARWDAEGELDQVTVLQLRSWAVERAVHAGSAPYGAAQAREVQEWRTLTQWLADNHHLDLGQ